MLAEHHIVMYEDEENGDILAISYIRDITEEFHENALKIETENLNKKTEKGKGTMPYLPMRPKDVSCHRFLMISVRR